MQIAAIVLAAGQASRFGSPKQAARLGQRSLLGWTLHHATTAGCRPVVVVSGAHPEAVRQELPPDIREVYHPDWAQGMLSSLQAGLRELIQLPDWTHCFVLTTDMPWFTADWLRGYVEAAQQSEQPADQVLVATSYDGRAGIPLLIPRSFTSTIQKVAPTEKLRPHLQNYPGIITVPSGEHTRDVDRPADLPTITSSHALTSTMTDQLPACPIPRWQLLKQQLHNVSPAEFTALIGQSGYQLIDVRTPEEYASFHLPGATNMDYLGPDFLEQMEGLQADVNYLVYCRSGRRSVRACTLMKNAGFQHLTHLDGGLNAWEAEQPK